MQASARTYDLLGVLLSYPGEDYLARAVECRDLLKPTVSGAAERLSNFIGRIGGLATDELQELFTITFDLNPVCTLEVGWHLHGDTYDRGEFLVRMRQMLRRCGVQESRELPDHLAHVLTALPRLDEAERREFIATAVAPAVAKMLTATTERDNPFEHMLGAAYLVLGEELPLPAVTRADDGGAERTS